MSGFALFALTFAGKFFTNSKEPRTIKVRIIVRKSGRGKEHANL